MGEMMVSKPSVLIVDDEPNVLKAIRDILQMNGFDAVGCERPLMALEQLRSRKPDLILLDVCMPEMNGYDFCTKLQADTQWNVIPVIFFTAMGDEENRAQAFRAGAVDFLTKPVLKDTLLATLRKYSGTREVWSHLDEGALRGVTASPKRYEEFFEFLGQEFPLSSEQRKRLSQIIIVDAYSITGVLGITTEKLAQLIAEFCHLTYFPTINPSRLKLGILPIAFCRLNSIVPVKGFLKDTFILANPFRLDLLDVLKSRFADSFEIAVSDPAKISSLLAESQLSSEAKSEKARQ